MVEDYLANDLPTCLGAGCGPDTGLRPQGLLALVSINTIHPIFLIVLIFRSLPFCSRLLHGIESCSLARSPLVARLSDCRSEKARSFIPAVPKRLRLTA